MCVCFLLFQVSCPLWGVLFIKEPGSWVEVRWEYQTAAGWSAYRKGRVVHLIFYTFSSTWRRTVGHFAQTALEYIKKRQISGFVCFLFSKEGSDAVSGLSPLCSETHFHNIWMQLWCLTFMPHRQLSQLMVNCSSILLQYMQINFESSKYTHFSYSFSIILIPNTVIQIRIWRCLISVYYVHW